MTTSRRLAVALIAATALALSGCGGDGEDTPPATDGGDDGGETAEFPEGSTMARLAEAGTITVGTKFDQPLFGLVGPDGVPEGFDVEIAKLIAGELGIDEDDIEWVETPSQNRETAIENGDVDIVVATYTINDERKQRVGFAGPYYLAGQSILTLASNTDIQGPDDLSGKRVCTVSGSTPEGNLLANFPDVDVVPFGTYSECLEPLRNGQVDAVSTDNVILAGFAAESDDLEVRGDPFTEEPYGIGIKDGDTEFCEFINGVLQEAADDGRYTEAWTSTVGDLAEAPELPELRDCS